MHAVEGDVTQSGKAAARALLGFFIGLHVLVLITLWFRIGTGVAPGVMLLSAVPLALASLYFARHTVHALTQLDLWVLGYAAWSVVSFVLYLQQGNPTGAGAFAYGVYNLALPIACYFAGKAIAREHHRLLLTGVVALHALVAVYGLYMHFARPSYYTDFVMRSLASGGATQEWQFFARLQSYLGSTVVGYLATTGIVLATLTGVWLRRALPFLVLAFTGAALLSLQRASLVALAIALLYVLIAARQNRGLQVVTGAGLIGAVVYGSIALGAAANPVRQRVESRATGEIVEGLANFFEERGYRRGLRYLQSFPLGVGLGATSSAADNAGYLTEPEVSDANYMRIAADLGPLGLALFLAVMAAATARALSGSNPTAWISFLVIHAGIMLSTNILDSYYVSHSFWLLLAIIDKDRHSP